MSEKPPELLSQSNVIDSLLHPQSVVIRSLLDRAERRDLNRILIDDEENIFQAIEGGVKLEGLFFTGEETITDELRRRLSKDIIIYEIAWRTCKKLFEKEKATRVFAIAQTPLAASLNNLTMISSDIVVLEDVSISGNIGAIVRTSFALGIGGVVLLNADPVDIYDRRLIRASRGFVFRLPVVAAGTPELITFCKAQGLALVVTAAEAEATVDELANRTLRLAIAFGNEKRGCSHELTSAADLTIRIPTRPDVESLNVSAAAGITLYSRLRHNMIL